MGKKLESISVPKERIESLAEKVGGLSEKTPISFEFVLMYLFPSVWEDIEKAIHDSYTKGYLQGVEVGKGGEDSR